MEENGLQSQKYLPSGLLQKKACPTLRTEWMFVHMKMKPEGTLTAMEPVWTLAQLLGL